MSTGQDNWPWTGRHDPADDPAALRWHQIVQKRGQQAAPVALLGFACDAGVARNHGRLGAADGPAALRRARSLGVSWVEDLELRAERIVEIERDLQAFIARYPRLYLTVCLNVLPGSVAPGVSAPAALGIDPSLVERLVETVIASGHVAIADVAGLSPPNHQDDRTARIAARFVAHIATAAQR